jgi:hypothetical protein
MPVTPQPGTAVVTTGGTAVVAVPANPNGGFITNPASAADQGRGSVEDLIVNPVSTAANGTAGNANGTNFRIAPGQTWQIIAGQTTPTSVNAISSGHKFSAIFW